MNEQAKKLSEALDVLAEFLNAGQSDKTNGNINLALHLIFSRLEENRAHIVTNWWCCALAQCCSRDQAVLIAKEWIQDGTLKEGWDKE